MKQLRLVTAVALALLLGHSAHADIVSVDLGRGDGGAHVGLAGAPDPAGATAVWNEIIGTSPTGSSLLDSIGATTPVGFSINSRSQFGAPADQEVSAAGGFAPLMTDYLSSRANDSGADLRTGVINGLVAGNAYDVYFYGQGDNFQDTGINGGQNVGIRIGTDVRHTSWDGVVGGDGLLVEDIEYVLFPGLVADVNGEINFEHFNPGVGVHGTDPTFFDSDTNSSDLDGNNSRFHALNGFQIVGDFTAIPEPSSFAILGGLGALVLVRRRK